MSARRQTTARTRRRAAASPRDYLAGSDSPTQYVGRIAGDAGQYNGFNLLVGDREQLIWYSNRAGDDARNGQPLAPGVYGLSNAGLDANWPKVVRTKAQFSSLLCQCAPEDAYFEMLTDATPASDCRLPQTGVSLELERLLSAVYIESSDYGTRASTVVRLAANDEPQLCERMLR